MIRRPKGFSPIDPLSVPLPHGTEVTTRIERVLGGTRVPRGVVGRVVKLRDDGVNVQVTGFGVVFYAATSWCPASRARCASRRGARPTGRRCGPAPFSRPPSARAPGASPTRARTPICAASSRSRSAGAAGWSSRRTASSAPTAAPRYWDFSKAIHQALRADPNTLELLFVPDGARAGPMRRVAARGARCVCLRGVFGSFGRYAMSQLSKLAHSQKLAEHRGLLLDWLREESPPDLDEVARRLADISPRKAPTRADALFAAKEYVKQLYRSLHDQGLIDACDFASLVRYAREGGKQPEPARELRPKNAYNLLRLIAVATDWLRTGHPQLEMAGAMRDRLLAIKRGEVVLEEVLRQAESMVPALEAARDATPLPKAPDVARADALLRRINAEVARRWIQQDPGPWGSGAPPAPEPTVEE